MRLYTLQRRHSIPRPRREVFDYFSRPENLAALTPPALGFTMLTPPPVPMNAGAVIDYTIRVGPFPLRWRTLISRYDPPERFIDVQLRGPYMFWHHIHEFADRDGITEMTDTVHYAVPGGILSPLVRSLLVARRLEEIFDYREQRLRELFPPEGV